MKMGKISVKPPSGFRDFTLQEASARSELIRKIEDTYRSFGFQQISTSVCENLATLQGKGGGQDNEHLIFKIMRRGEALKKAFDSASEADLDSLADLGMRFELTLPLARYVSRFRNDLVFPFKAFHIGNVYRAERPQKGRYREFMQCDVDVVGCDNWGAELDALQAIISVFLHIGIDNLEVQLNDRRILDAAAKAWKIAPADWAAILVSLDKLDKIGVDGVKAELESKGYGKYWDQLHSRFFAETAGNLKSWRDLASKEVDRLSLLSQGLCTFCEDSNISIRFCPTMVRGQEYYTGTIFELHHPDLQGSLGGGGRYDKLLELFGGPKTPAFGGSIGFERLFLLYSEKLSQSDRDMGALEVLFPVFSEDLRLELQQFANQLRRHGISTEVFPEASKLKQQFRYANQRHAKYTVSIGPDEFAGQSAKIKDMASGEEISVRLQDLETELLARCRP